jgi:enamine deaminase RidA (YjgF/YER057c/UK114 family)
LFELTKLAEAAAAARAAPAGPRVAATLLAPPLSTMSAPRWLLLLLLLPRAGAYRRAIGTVTERYSEGILTWDGLLTPPQGSGSLQVAGMLGVSCGAGIAAQTECALEENERIFALGFEVPVEEHPMQHSTLCSVYLQSMADFDDMNVIYEEFFRRQGIEEPPARVALVAAGLPADALIEVQCRCAGAGTASNMPLAPSSCPTFRRYSIVCIG